MVSTVLLCSDGSDLALSALSRGLSVIAAADRTAVATVVEFVHPIDVVGTGMAGGVISPAEATRLDEEQVADGQRVLAETCAHLGLTGAEQFVLRGSAGPALCELADSLPATVMILGTRGRGGLRRAVLGSVSDHVVRHAPCPVVISGAVDQ
jgi:nucleotide-binding universal stress UspA family protein